jgi:hypothetical protein
VIAIAVGIRNTDTAAVRVKKLYNGYLDTLYTVCVVCERDA